MSFEATADQRPDHLSALEKQSWVTSVVTDAYQAVAEHPLESAVVAGVAAAGAAAFAISRGKINIPRFAHIDDYRQGVGSLDFPFMLDDVQKLPKNKIVDLENGIRALVDKEGYLTAISQDRQYIFMTNKDGTRVGHVFGNDPLLKSSYSISGREGTELASATKLARNSEQAGNTSFSYFRDAAEREQYNMRRDSKTFRWNFDENRSSPARDAVTKAFDAIEDDLLARAQFLIKAKPL